MSQTTTIYRSHIPDIPLGPPTGLFQYLFNNTDKVKSDTVACIDALSGEKYTRQQLIDLSLQCAYSLKQSGVKRGDVGMVFSPNSIAFPIALLGFVAAGAKATLANASYQPHELAHQLKNSRAGLVFVYPALLPILIKAFESLGVSEKEAQKRTIILSYTSVERGIEQQAKIGPEWKRLGALLGKGKLDKAEHVSEKEALDTVLLCYSSGTTGLSKGVETTHQNLQAVVEGIMPLFRIPQPDDVMLAVLPMFHIFGVTMVLLFHLHFGIPQVVMPRFDPELFCSSIERYKVTVSHIVPPILVVLLNHPATEKYNLQSLDVLGCGAAPLSRELVSRVRTKFRKIGNEHVSITQGYGLTETSPATHFLPRELSDAQAGSIGYLLPNLEARLVDDDDKDIPISNGAGVTDLEKLNRGELWIRGPVVMKGYLYNEKATKDSITKDGWFKTGDVAVRDQHGLFYIVDRKKELIKYKGFQVPPADLEAVLLSHEEIADAAVIGVWSEKDATELPRAYVVSTSNAELLKDASKRKAFESKIQAWVKATVANHKQCRGGVVVIEAIPKSATGKILRKDLRALVEQEKKGKAKL